MAYVLDFEVTDPIRVLVGVYSNREGKVTVLDPDAPKPIGVTIYGAEPCLVTARFKPEEIEKLK